MSSSFSIWIILSVYVVVDAADVERLSYPADDRSDTMSHVIGTRWSRSVAGIADVVVKAFMKGAKEVSSKSPNYRKFLKKGTEFDAVTDFNSLNSNIVKRQGYGAIGVMGDSKVKLKLRDGKNSNLPTVQIWDPNMEKSVKFVYINKPILY